MSAQDFDRQRAAMVSNQLRTSAVFHAGVLTAMAAVPRERFVSEGHAGVAYRDTIVPLGGGRALNPPIAIARLIQAADPVAGARVLLVGAGTGYTAAVFAAMGCVVTALEQDPALLAKARVALEGVAGVTLVEGPLAQGWAAGAPYDAIVVDGAIEQVPDTLIEQLTPDGRLVAAIHERGLVSRLVCGRRRGSGFGYSGFAESDTAPLPGFAPAPAFTF